MLIPISDIIIGPRHRKDMGDLQVLADSIEDQGLLQAIGITEDRELVFGKRRLEAAKKLNIPVWYIIGENNVPIYKLQRATIPWSIRDYLGCHCRAGRQAYVTLKEFQERTGFNLQDCISLLSGETGSSSNQNPRFKEGNFEIRGMDHAKRVERFVNIAKNAGFSGALHRYFINAISKVLKTRGVNLARLADKLAAYAHLVEHQPDVRGFLKEIEKVYNRQSGDKIPLAFMAETQSKERQMSITGKDPNKNRTPENFQ